MLNAHVVSTQVIKASLMILFEVNDPLALFYHASRNGS
jgi:hypothetical protein